MKKFWFGVAFLSTVALAGCDFQNGVATTVGVVSSVIANSPQACADLASLGAGATNIVNQIAAANPNDVQIQKSASRVTSGVGAANSDCQRLAGAFKAQAPKSLLGKKVLIDPKIFSRLQ